MPRKGPASRRPLTPDPIYQSQLVTQMINKILLKGKRSTAERIVSALEQCRRKTGNDPIVTTLKRAVGERPAGAGDQEPGHLPGPDRGPADARPPWPCAGWSTSPGPAARRPWPTGWPASWTPPTAPAPPSSARKTPTRWPRPTGPSPITGGSSAGEPAGACRGITRTKEVDKKAVTNTAVRPQGQRQECDPRVPASARPQHRDHGPHRPAATTTTERILYYTGRTYKIGEVHEGAYA